MPANLPPVYHAAEKRYRQANSPEEKIEALREMHAVMPKHKGTDKLQADIKRKIAQLKDQAKKAPAARQVPQWVIEKVGAGQVPVIGPPNAGKSALIAEVTHAEVRVAEYPFTTQGPAPAMMPFENIQIQLIDTPAWSEEFDVGWLPELTRRADACVLVADLSDELAEEMIAFIVDHMEARDVVLTGSVSDEREGFEVYVPTLLVGNKSEAANAGGVLAELERRFADRFPICVVSVGESRGLDEFKRALFDVMAITRVFTKQPGKEADLGEPFVLPAGSTVHDLAAKIHKEILASLKYARLWGESGRFKGQRVGEDHVLADGDIVELHTR
ncbi:MAG: TGS domain-containing protein [Gemmatimonadota bacterium]|nr:MAG: TGS domain-containing protein [Gemmatimonadota bacterium]